jgi:hypothetical protein
MMLVTISQSNTDPDRPQDLDQEIEPSLTQKAILRTAKLEGDTSDSEIEHDTFNTHRYQMTHITKQITTFTPTLPSNR